MKRTGRSLLIGLLLATPLLAEPFERFEITKSVGTVVRRKATSVKTGRSSRAELQLPSLAIVRVGANTDLSFLPDGRMVLNSGTLLASSSRGAGVMTVIAGTLTATTKGSVFELGNTGASSKAICLNGRVSVALTTNPKERAGLRPGQMVDVAAGATKMPGATSVNLKTLISTSGLMKMGPIPGQRAVERNANQQAPHPMAWVSKAESDSPPPPLIAQSRAAAAAQTTINQTTRITTLAFPLPVPVAAPAPVQNLGQNAAQQRAEQEAAAARAAALLAVARRAQIIQQQRAQQQAVQQQVAAQQVAAQQQAAQQQAAAQQAAQGNQGQGVGVGGTPPGQGNQGQGIGVGGTPPGQQ